jgi:hypothetical protein
MGKIRNLKKWIAEKSENKPFEKESIGKAAEWLINSTEEIGIDVKEFEHEVTNYFVNHVLKRHGDPKTEESLRQIAVREEDFNNIEDIVKNPDYAIIGAKRNGEDVLFYAKRMEDGSIVYLEEILNGKKNKTLRSKTLFRRKDDISDEYTFLKIASGEGKTDLSKIKTVSLQRAGGNPSFAPDKPAADATSTLGVDQLSANNLPHPPAKVNDKNMKKFTTNHTNQHERKDIHIEISEAEKKLEEFAVPMIEVEYSKEEYNRFFKGGYVKTPIKIVKMGAEQFEKLERKDKGTRKSYIGAAYQTLTDPVVIIKEGNDDVYIKSFLNKKGFSTFVSVEKNKEDDRFVVTNYFRHKSEVLKKIKWADGVVYLKDSVDGSPARMDKEGVPHAESSHTPIISHEPDEKSSSKRGT